MSADRSEPTTTAATGVVLIASERKRQIEAEGWSIEHDRKHGPNRLSLAAQAYEQRDSGRWPFDNGASFKPKGPLRDLIRAGALFQAAADIADPESYFSPAYYEVGRDRCAQKIDALIADVREVLGAAQMHPAPPVGGSGQACGKCHDHA